MKTNIGLILLTAILLCSCGGSERAGRDQPAGHRTDPRKPLAWGHEQTIYVFADDRVWHYAEKPLRESIERYFYTTENETMFDLKRADFDSIEHFYRFKNLIFFAHLDSERRISEYVKERLTENVLQSVQQNGIGIFTRHNLWANDQLVVFMLGDTEANLLRLNILQSDEVFDQFRSKLFARTENRVYNFDIKSASFFQSFPWYLRIPDYYVVYKRKDSDNFISFIARRREQPDRYLSVYFEDMRENMVNSEWVRETRARLAWEYYDEDVFTREDTRMQIIDFKGFEAHRFSGRWQNFKHAVGGAFQSFAFYDEENQRAYLIDNSVFYPEGFKLPALIELEVISRSFSLGSQNNTNRDSLP